MELVVANEVISTATRGVMSAVGQELDYAWNCNDYIGKLTSELEDLKHVSEMVMRDVEAAKKGGEKIYLFVDDWLTSATQLIDKADKFLQDKDRAQQKCVGGLCRPWKTRYEMGRRAKKEMLPIFDELKQKKESFKDRVSYLEGPKGIGPIEGYEEFESRKSIIEIILKALADPNVHKIGIYGINGVGKTTLAKEIARQVENNLFDEIVMATVFPDKSTEEMQEEAIVKKTPNIKAIQDEIADGLDFHFRKTTDRKRADELCERLKDEKRKLIVLDNVWAGLDLKDVGISSDHEGCKILMISTNEKVLSHEMDSEHNFQLDVLTTEESEEWFKKMVGDVAKDRDLQENVTQVAARCAGLPILLIPVAKGLKDKGDLQAWKDALKQLSSFDKKQFHTNVNLALQLSYNLLGDDEIKKLFLLCAQFGRPRWLHIRTIFRYAMGLGLFKGKNTVAEVDYRLLNLLNDLKSCCLLLQTGTQGFVEMHDIVYNFAVSIASREHHVFIAPKDSLLEWPMEDKMKQLTAITLSYCKITELPPVLDCPNLESFLLFSADRSLKIPPNFFERLSKLKLLDITRIHLSPLPQSFECIQNLRTLCLDWCDLEDMTILGKLNALCVLSFEGSDFVELPKQVKKLTRLQSLNLNGCKRLEVIQPNVLSCLALLEELCMENSFLQWEFEGQKSRTRNASMDELRRLPNLKILDMHVTNVKMLPKGLLFENLENFKILIGDGWNWAGENKTSRILKLKLSEPGKLGRGIKALLKKAGDLYLDELKGIGNSLDVLDGQGFPQLKHLHLENSHETQYLINFAGMVAFTSLELLFLENLENLEKLCNGRLSAESFGQLTTLTVGRCGGLKNLFSSSMARGLMRLKEITITDCKILEEIVCEESDEDAGIDEPIKFPQLHTLELHILPQFKTFFSNKKASPVSEETGNAFPETDANSEKTASKDDPKTAEALSNKNACFCGLFCSKLKGLSSSETEQKLPASDRNSKAITMENDPSSVFNKKVSFPNMKNLKLTSIMIEKIWHEADVGISSCIPNLTSLAVVGCDNLKCLFSSSMAETLGNLKTLEISNCKLMEEIIFMEGLDDGGESKTLFQKLESLHLKDLPKLAQFCNINLLKCSALKKLLIDNCSKLETFISNTGVNVDSQDQTVNSALFDEKVAFPNLETLGIFNMSGLKTIYGNKLYENSFSKLKRLELENIEELQNVFSSHYVLRRLQNLECLVIANCSSIEKVFDIQGLKDVTTGHEMVSSKLRILKISDLPMVKCIWNDAGEINSFQDLHEVEVKNCPNMRNIFPLYIARSLRKLTTLHIESCGTEEIISYEKGTETVAEFEFPQLTTFQLWWLPQLKRFLPGKQTIEFPKLKDFFIYECDNMKIFTSESQNVEEEFTEEDQLDGAQQPLMSAEMVIPNLEALSLRGKDVKMISDGQFTQDLFLNVKLLSLQCFHDASTAFSFGLIQKFVNLRELLILNSSFTEILSSTNLAGEESQERNLIKIEALTLSCLYNLKRIEIHHVLENLEELNVFRCENLSILAPSSASFKNLTDLEVGFCNALVKLVTFSTAKSMVQLRKLSIEECDLMTEVLANDGEDEEDLVLHKLESLKLLSLKNLSSFCSAKWTIKVPSLEEVVVSQCPKMRTFSNGVLEAAKLRGVNTNRDKRHWKSDLNATIEDLYAKLAGFDGLNELKVSEFTELARKWPKEIPGSFFGDTISLVIDECSSSSIAVPSNVLSSLKLLQELEIRNCDSVEEVFDNEKPNTDENSGHLFNLVEFRLFDLPKLSQIWNQYSTGILNLKNLKLLKVHNCSGLRSIFIPSIATGLVQLEEMEVKSCDMIEEIIAIEEVQKEGAEKMEFPLLSSVTLENLPKLRSFYVENGSVEFPSLTSISVVDCPSAILNQSVAVPSLETLILEWSNSTEKVLLHDQCREDVLQKLKCFELVRFSHDHSVFPSHFLGRLSGLENLVLRDASIEEIVLHEEKNDDDNLIKILTQLRELKLSKFPKLKFLPDSSLFSQNLESLEVLECHSLEILVPASVSFRCLKSMEVSKCHGLQTVITSSTAKSLVQLTTLSISDCEMVTAIITHNDDEVEDEIAFSKLKHLRLHNLLRLRSFCLGMCKLTFPSLEELKVTECPDMETFSQADQMIPRLKNVEVTESDKLQQLLEKMGHFQIQSNRSLTWKPTKGLKNATEEKRKTLGVPAGQVSDISTAEKSTTLGVTAGQPSDIAVSEKHTTVSVSSGEASNVSIVEKSTTPSFPVGEASNNFIAENIKLSVPVAQASDISTEEKSATTSVPGQRVLDNFLSTKNPDSSFPVEDETSINVKFEERATSTQSEITRMASATQDSHATSIPEENATENGVALHNEARISVQTLKHPQMFDQSDQPAEDVVSESFNQQTSTIPVFPYPVEQATLSTAADSTMTTSSNDFNVAGSSSHTPADFESLFASMEDLLKPQKDSFAKSMDSLKKILKKSLAEVARSADAPKLLKILRNLKNSPNLNPEQVEIIQDYVENFDSLVAHNTLYEQQIEMGSSLNHSIKEKQTRITNLKTLCQDSIIKADSLGKTKEELKKRLYAIEEEEKGLRARIEQLCSDMAAEKGELETDIDVVPEVARSQEEAEEKASKANDSWEKLKELFM